VIHPFDRPPEVDDAELVSILGGKGAGLARMTALGLPVPPGFTISTKACHRTLDSGWPAELGPLVVPPRNRSTPDPPPGRRPPRP